MRNIFNAAEAKNALDELMHLFHEKTTKAEQCGENDPRTISDEYAYQDAYALMVSELEAFDGVMAPDTTHAKMRADFIKETEREASCGGEYPQYVGYFNHFVLCTVTRAVNASGGRAFTAGTITLCSPIRFASMGPYLVWSAAVRALVVVSEEDVRVHT